jgi:hypothetical protein
MSVMQEVFIHLVTIPTQTTSTPQVKSGGGEVTRKRAGGNRQPEGRKKRARKKQPIKHNYFVDLTSYQMGPDSDASDAGDVSDSRSSDSSDEGNVAPEKLDLISAITRAKPDEKIPVAPEVAVTGHYIKFRTDGVYSFNCRDRWTKHYRFDGQSLVPGKYRSSVYPYSLMSFSGPKVQVK